MSTVHCGVIFPCSMLMQHGTGLTLLLNAHHKTHTQSFCYKKVEVATANLNMQTSDFVVSCVCIPEMLVQGS